MRRREQATDRRPKQTAAKSIEKVCVDCANPTWDFYPAHSGHGALVRCKDCHEQMIRQESRRISDQSRAMHEGSVQVQKFFS